MTTTSITMDRPHAAPLLGAKNSDQNVWNFSSTQETAL